MGIFPDAGALHGLGWSSPGVEVSQTQNPIFSRFRDPP